MLALLATNSKEADDQDWRIGERGWLDFFGNCLSASWACKVYPGVELLFSQCHTFPDDHSLLVLRAVRFVGRQKCIQAYTLGIFTSFRA